MEQLLMPDRRDREALWSQTGRLIDDYIDDLPKHRIVPDRSALDFLADLEEMDVEDGGDLSLALDRLNQLFSEGHIHTGHPGYMGRFNPAVVYPAVLAEALVSIHNPQLAATHYSPFPIAAERFVVEMFAKMFQLGEAAGGNFTSGGGEANLTAVICALHRRWPEVRELGLRGLDSDPVAFVSDESHATLQKAMGNMGLGGHLVVVPTDSAGRIQVDALEQAVEAEVRSGRVPFLFVTSIGTTGTGAVDDTPAIARIARTHSAWLHADAAWGGSMVLLPEKSSLFRGFESVDSVTFDAHKWMAMCFNGGMFLTRHHSMLDSTFNYAPVYMPGAEDGLEDPYTTSVQWSRRFLGLKVLLSLASIGLSGFRRMLRKELELLDYICEQAEQSDWSLVNDPACGVACFEDGTGVVEGDDLREVERQVVATGSSWLASTRANGRRVLRICVTNFKSTRKHVDALISELNAARDRVSAGRS